MNPSPLRAASHARAAGFTLIELLVVITIIGVLTAALLPRVTEARVEADIAADQANMRWHYQNLLSYDARKKGFKYGGSQFVIAPWISGIAENTLENFERYWTPGINDPVRRELIEDVGIENIWKTIDDVDSSSTSYAGRAREKLRGRVLSGKNAIMANDQEYGPAFSDQTINVLMGGGSVRSIFLDELKDLGYEGDGEEDWFRVGPDSTHELLQQVDV